MSFVALPSAGAWHYVDPTQIIGIKAVGPNACEVLLKGGTSLAVSEESYAVVKRFEAHAVPPNRHPSAPATAQAPNAKSNGQRTFPKTAW